MFGLKPWSPRYREPDPDGNFQKLLDDLSDRYIPVGLADFSNGGDTGVRIVVVHTAFKRGDNGIEYTPEILLYAPINVTGLDVHKDLHLCDDEEKSIKDGKHPAYSVIIPNAGPVRLAFVGEISTAEMGFACEGLNHGRFVGFEPLTNNPQSAAANCNLVQGYLLSGDGTRTMAKWMKKLGSCGETADRMKFAETHSLQSQTFAIAAGMLIDKQCTLNSRVNDKMSGKYDIDYRPFSFHDAAAIANTQKNCELVASDLSGTYLLGLSALNENMTGNNIVMVRIDAKPVQIYEGKWGVSLADSKLIFADPVPRDGGCPNGDIIVTDTTGADYFLSEGGAVSATMVEYIPHLSRTTQPAGRVVEAVKALGSCMDQKTISPDTAFLLSQSLVSGTRRVPDDARKVPLCDQHVAECITTAMERNPNNRDFER